MRQSQQNRQNNEPDFPIPLHLRDKYEIGLHTLGDKTFTSDQFLLNPWDIESFDIPELLGLQMLTIPSRDFNGVINEIGYRVINPALIQDTVKWIFPYGQHATFGLQHCDTSKPIYLVEGAWDYIAARESGIDNVIGLGSVRLSEYQQQVLNQFPEAIMCFDNDGFGTFASEKWPGKTCTFEPKAKDPFEAYLMHGKIRFVDAVKDRMPPSEV